MGRWQGIFLDFYGTVAAGDRAAVEDICHDIVTEFELGMRACEMAADWGRAFFREIDQSNRGTFKSLMDCERDSLAGLMKAQVSGFDPGPSIEKMRAYLQAPPLHDEVKAVLSQIDLPICCVSNVDREDLDKAVALHQLPFAFSVTSEDAASYKPAEKIFMDALAVTGWSADRVLHVGDSVHSDVQGALRAGLTAVWIERGDRISDIGQVSAHHRFTDLWGLVDLCKKSQ
jgi:2-haloacid dehalogenase/putative hydrolase of the HAD superfamily